MNFLQGSIRRQGGLGRVEIGDGISLPLPANQTGVEGQKIVYGIRPEHVMINIGGDGMPAVVEVIEPTGADTLVFASVSGSAFCVAGRERYSFRPGATINLEPVLEYVHVFDEESGRSLTVQ